MKFIFKLIVILSFITNVINGLAYPKNYNFDESATSSSGDSFPAHWFQQILDHFNGQTNATFSQKYYINDQYYDYQQGGDIILYINGEGPVSGPPYQDADGVVIYAKALNAMIVTLEHRYYGESTPFLDLTLENLQYLTHQQALEDLANFIVAFSNGLANSRKIVTIGGSYSGALSAWFRIKYPHITVGSIASSGVVNAILDFNEFDSYVSFAAGPECTSALQAVTAAVENLYFSSQQPQLLQILQAETLVEIGDFFYFVADSMAEAIQYGYYDQLCNPLVDAVSKGIPTDLELVTLYSNYTINTWSNVGLGQPIEYSTAWQQNITHDATKADRQWWYQCCSKLAYFQPAPSTNSIRSQFVNMTYFQQHCEAVFGSDLSWPPNTEEVNIQYGGDQSNPKLNAAGTNILFTQGFSDPWSRASIFDSLYPTIEPSVTVDCKSCGHCIDLRGCPNGCELPNNLDEVRAYSIKLLSSWLGQ